MSKEKTKQQILPEWETKETESMSQDEFSGEIPSWANLPESDFRADEEEPDRLEDGDEIPGFPTSLTTLTWAYFPELLS